MRKFFYLLAAMACIAIANAQTIGIGTNAPNTNAILDIFSNNKGVLIPRILDTINVPNPLEGLIIYNKNTKSPYYYNGTQWLSLGGRLPSSLSTSTDRITYQVTGSGISNTELPILATASGVTYTQPQSSAQDYAFYKEYDINSKALNLATFQGTQYSSIEFKFYAQNAVIPYVSIRLSNITIASYQTSVSAGGGAIAESISIKFQNYGLKDWVNNTEFGYDVVNHTISSY